MILSFKTVIGDARLLASKSDSDTDAVVLMRAARIIRKKMFQVPKLTFASGDQHDVNPASLVALFQNDP